MKIAKMERRQVFNGTDWHRTVTLDDGRAFRVGVYRGRRVRVAFKPRGFVGFKWYGSVRDAATGAEVWSGEVGGSIGARGVLYRAGLVERGESPKDAQRRVRGAKWEAAARIAHAAGEHGLKEDPFCPLCRESWTVRPIGGLP